MGTTMQHITIMQQARHNHRHHHRSLFPLLCILLLSLSRTVASTATSTTWAVIASTSRYWYNYRHMANALAMYHTVKRMGIPDSHIILMLPDDTACNPRNPLPGAVYAHIAHDLDLYGDTVQVDYRGYDVTVTNFVRLLTGRHDHTVPLNQRLGSDAHSNVLIYLSGHGGEDFLKFQGVETLTSTDVTDALSQMAAQGRFGSLLFIADTCKAASLFNGVAVVPHVVTVASSKSGENSYSYVNDDVVGLTVVDRFTYFLLHALEQLKPTSNVTLAQLFAWLRTQPLGSTMVTGGSVPAHTLASTPVTAYFSTQTQALPIQRSQKHACPPPMDTQPSAHKHQHASAMQEMQDTASCGDAQRKHDDAVEEGHAVEEGRAVEECIQEDSNGMLDVRRIPLHAQTSAVSSPPSSIDNTCWSNTQHPCVLTTHAWLTRILGGVSVATLVVLLMVLPMCVCIV